MERFTIPDTIIDFVIWSNEYGVRKQEHFSRSQPDSEYEGDSAPLHHPAGPWDSSLLWGDILFHFYPQPDGPLNIKAQMDGWGQPPESLGYFEELKRYFDEMMAAIHERWSNTTVQDEKPKSAKIPLPDTPPLPGTDGYTWDDVFDWYYRVPRWKCASVSDLRKIVGKPERTFFRQKEKYEATYGQDHIPDDQSKFS